MYAVLTAFYPLVIGLNGLGNFVLRRFGIDRQAESSEHLYSPEELALLVEEKRRRRPATRRRKPDAARPVRVRRPARARSDGARVQSDRQSRSAPRPTNAAAIVSSHPHTRFPVLEDDLDHIDRHRHIKGLLRLVDARRPHTASKDVQPVPDVPETAPLDAVLETYAPNTPPWH